MKHVFIFGLILCIVKLNKCYPHNSTVTSKYARVAVWGSNKSDASVIRNRKSEHMWNHRLDPKSISPTSKKKNPSIAYQYPVYQKPESKIDTQIEHVPGIGEVIVAQAQDRFEARPLFAYRNKVVSATYGPPAAPKPSLPLPSAPPPSASPVAAPPAAPPALNRNLYNSPYSSYNPPVFNPDDSGGPNLYPPNIPLNDDIGSMDSAAMQDQTNASTEEVKANTPDSYASLGPPLVPYKNNHNNDDDDSGYGPHDFLDHAPPHDPMAMYKPQDGPPQHPPQSVDDVYYPPDFPKDQIPDHSMMDGNEDEMMPPKDQGMMPPALMDSGKHNDGHSAADVDDDIGMAPPPSPEHEHGHAFPKYLYDQHHYDHHVYEEIPHTTMEPAKEDKRVSSTNYSYYYLGRKLWYIPLYFSIYFIIYVTVLILKSIARHKVRLKYRWYEQDTSAKHARSMNLDVARLEELTDLHRNVSAALQNTTAKYNSVIAM